MNGYDPYGLEWTDDDATIARIEAYEAACVDGSITADDVMPDPDSVEVIIGCAQDAEADEMHECDPVCARCPYYNTPWSCNGGTDEHPCPNGADDPEVALTAANVAMHAGQNVQQSATSVAPSVPCPTCGGSGEAPMKLFGITFPCPTCHGTGVK